MCDSRVLSVCPNHLRFLAGFSQNWRSEVFVFEYF